MSENMAGRYTGKDLPPNNIGQGVGAKIGFDSYAYMPPEGIPINRTAYDELPINRTAYDELPINRTAYDELPKVSDFLRDALREGEKRKAEQEQKQALQRFEDELRKAQETFKARAAANDPTPNVTALAEKLFKGEKQLVELDGYEYQLIDTMPAAQYGFTTGAFKLAFSRVRKLMPEIKPGMVVKLNYRPEDTFRILERPDGVRYDLNHIWRAWNYEREIIEEVYEHNFVSVKKDGKSLWKKDAN